MKRRQFLAISTLSPLFLNPIQSLAASLGDKANKSSGAFSFGSDKQSFYLNGDPFVIRSGEMHYPRIPKQYWQHRIRMAKAMGLNTISTYVFWNYHEAVQNKIDFYTGNRDLGEFLRLCQAEGMYVLIRPGPFVAAEWDFGGLPSWLLNDPNMRIRTGSANNPAFMNAVRNYYQYLATVLRPYMLANGGPILMLQIENEYGNFPRDNSGYLEELKNLWLSYGINGPFYSEDGYGRTSGHVSGAALALSGGNYNDVLNWKSSGHENVPVMIGEMYFGWLTAWGERFPSPGTSNLQDMLDHDISFNIYVVHGGTNFGLTSGTWRSGDRFTSVITSYDYGAPINEAGQATSVYYNARNAIQNKTKQTLINVPPLPNPLITLGNITLSPIISLSKALEFTPNVVSLQSGPQALETLFPAQNNGLIVYRSNVSTNGRALSIEKVRDYATVYFGNDYIGAYTRVETGMQTSSRTLDASRNVQYVNTGTFTNISLPSRSDRLDIYVEAHGHDANAGPLDLKGILGQVKLGNDPIQNWTAYGLALNDLPYWYGSDNISTGGVFFAGTFQISSLGDTYLDMSQWVKGMVWVNGHNLGRYWSTIGPQQRLYCPGAFLQNGNNVIVVLDFHQPRQATTVTSATKLIG